MAYFFDIIASSSLPFVLILFLMLTVLICLLWLFFYKYNFFISRKNLSISFKNEFYSGDMLDKIYNKLSEKKKIYSPLARIFFAGMRELTLSGVKKIDFSEWYSERIKNNVVNRIKSVMLTERAKNIYELKKSLSYFLVTSSIMPLIGIMGAVWEIMETFHTLDAYKVVNLSLVIPGIAQSLLAVIFGILIAVVSILLYNILLNKLNYFTEESELFALELASIFSRELDILTNNAVLKRLEEKKNIKNEKL
jgi:biopolymer transport protein TolQ